MASFEGNRNDKEVTESDDDAPAQPNIDAATISDDTLTYSYDVLDKQYRLYGWFDSKMQSMLAINGASAAAVTFFIKDAEFLNNSASDILLYVSLAFLVTSLLTILFHAIPRMDSGISTEVGTRSLVHIVRQSKDEYFAKLADSSRCDILRLNCQQITGMAHNNVASNSILRWSALCSFAGMCALAVALALGVWFGDEEQLSQATEHSEASSSQPKIPAAGADEADNNSGARVVVE